MRSGVTKAVSKAVLSMAAAQASVAFLLLAAPARACSYQPVEFNFQRYWQGAFYLKSDHDSRAEDMCRKKARAYNADKHHWVSWRSEHSWVRSRSRYEGQLYITCAFTGYFSHVNSLKSSNAFACTPRNTGQTTSTGPQAPSLKTTVCLNGVCQ